MMTNTQPTPTTSKLKLNLWNLARRALNGEWDRVGDARGDDRVRDQVMRLYRGAEFPPTVRDAWPCPACARVHDSREHLAAHLARHACRPDDDGAPPIASEASAAGAGEAPAPAVARRSRARVGCPESKRHGSLKGKGESCAACGYNAAPAAPTPGDAS